MEPSSQTGVPQTHILLVEDELDDAVAVQRGLPAGEGYQLTHVRTGVEGVEAAVRSHFDVALVDHRLQDLSGVEVCRQLREAGFSGALILLSSIEVEDTIAKAYGAGADEFIRKTNDYGERLRDAVSMLRDS